MTTLMIELCPDGCIMGRVVEVLDCAAVLGFFLRITTRLIFECKFHWICINFCDENAFFWSID